jgi:gamma-glutamyl hercynylcysteine S-oxide hydrolase
MCRHLAYIGPPASLRSRLIDPPHSLYRQAWAPRMQRHGTVNADGFGVGWYADGDPVPARYRQAGPIWGDVSLPDLARVVSSGAVLAAVRSASPGMASGPEACAPFGCGPWLFSHNGMAQRWREWGDTSLLPSLEALVDSALLWSMVLRRLRAGSAMDTALAGTIAAVEVAGGTGRFNLLLTDGRTIAATACGDSLWYRRSPGGVTVASEPDDDGSDWTEVADKHVLTATGGQVRVRPLAGLSGAPPARCVPTTGSDVSTEGIFTS